MRAGRPAGGAGWAKRKFLLRGAVARSLSEWEEVPVDGCALWGSYSGCGVRCGMPPVDGCALWGSYSGCGVRCGRATVDGCALWDSSSGWVCAVGGLQWMRRCLLRVRVTWCRVATVPGISHERDRADALQRVGVRCGISSVGMGALQLVPSGCMCTVTLTGSGHASLREVER